MPKDSPRKSSPVIAGGLLLIIAYFTINVGQTLYQSQHNSGRLQDLQKQVDQLRQQQQQLQEQAQVKQTAQFVESEARNKLNLARPNETIVIFPETAGATDDTINSGHTDQPSQSGLPDTFAAWQKIFW